MIQRFESQFPALTALLNNMKDGKAALLPEKGLRAGRDIITLINEMFLHEFNPIVTPVYYESKVCQLLLAALQRIFRPDSFLRDKLTAAKIEKAMEVKEILLSEMAGKLSIRDLAKKVGTNESSLKENFRNVFGTTIYQFGLQIRLEHAKKLLLETDLPIDEISMLVGYPDRSNLYPPFIRHFGYSPGFLRNEK